MSDAANEPSERWSSRLTAVEELLLHLEHTVGQLHELALQQGRRLDALEQRTVRLGQELSQATEPPEPPRDPAEERPPHY